MKRTAALIGTLSALLLPYAAPFTQAQTAPANGFANIIIEQQGDIDGTYGSWTLIKPNNLKETSTSKKKTVQNALPGNYTIIVTPPEGARASTTSYIDGELYLEHDKPQMTIPVEANKTIAIVIYHSFVHVGTVAVNSDPGGMTFTLKGPNGMVLTDFTPASFESMPEGLWSVTFDPLEDCVTPKPQSDKLVRGDRVSFNIKVACDNLDQLELKQREQIKVDYVNVSIDGQSVVFEDVPVKTWFAPYVQSVLKTGVMSGYRDENGALTGTFGPSDSITIAQLAKIAHELANIDENKAQAAPQNTRAQNQWFERYIASAEYLDWEIYKDPRIDPLRPATRGEVVNTLLQALDVRRFWPHGILFTDVSRNTPYASSIETAATDGVIEGYKLADGTPTGRFGPNDPVNRAEMSKIADTMIKVYLTPQDE